MGEISGGDAKALFGDDLTAGINALPEGTPNQKALEARFGELADYLLAHYRMAVDDETRGRLLVQCATASIEAAWRLKDNADGIYGLDKRIDRFGEPFLPPHANHPETTAKVTLTGLFESWWKEAKATGLKPSTHESYGTAIAGFVKYLGHDDAAKVTAENVIGWKDHRLGSINPRNGKPISARTVKGADLSGLKTVFGWAVGNRKVPTNPTLGVTVKLGKRQIQTRPKGFTDAEAKAVLESAESIKKGLERPKTFAAKRWVPWLCAYTGARVGEIAQLRKEDIRQEAELWVIHITPEAGTVKTNQARDVVLHEHLVEKGFPAFVAAAEPGHLFITPNRKTKDVLGPLQGITNRLGEQARLVVKDPLVKPNHGWRHRFKTDCRDVGIDHRVMDAIQGHAPRTSGDDYGDVTLKAMALAMKKFPRHC
jgi:integrase